MKGLHVVAIAVLFMCLGLAIGRVSAPQTGARAEGFENKISILSKDRSAQLAKSSLNDLERIGVVDGASPKSYDNRILHIKALAKKGRED